MTDDDLDLSSRLRTLEATARAEPTSLSSRTEQMLRAVRRRRRAHLLGGAATAGVALAVVAALAIAVPRALLDHRPIDVGGTPSTTTPPTSPSPSNSSSSSPAPSSSTPPAAPPPSTPPTSPSAWWQAHPGRRPALLADATLALSLTGSSSTRVDAASASLPAAEVVSLALSITCTSKDSVALELLDADGSTRLQTFVTCTGKPVVYQTTPVDPADPPATFQVEAGEGIGYALDVWTVPSVATLPLPHHAPHRPPGKTDPVEQRTANGIVYDGGVDARGTGVDFLGENYWKGTVDGTKVVVHAGSNGSQDPDTGAIHGDRDGGRARTAWDALGAPVTVPGAGAMWIVGEDGHVLTIRGEDGRTYHLDLRTWTVTSTR